MDIYIYLYIYMGVCVVRPVAFHIISYLEDGCCCVVEVSKAISEP